MWQLYYYTSNGADSPDVTSDMGPLEKVQNHFDFLDYSTGCMPSSILVYYAVWMSMCSAVCWLHQGQLSMSRSMSFVSATIIISPVRYIWSSIQAFLPPRTFVLARALSPEQNYFMVFGSASSCSIQVCDPYYQLPESLAYQYYQLSSFWLSSEWSPRASPYKLL